jgi:hypothetical protein
MSITNPEISSASPEIESIINRELNLIKIDRAQLLREVGVSESEIRSVMQAADVRAVFSIDTTRAIDTQVAPLWVLEWYLAGMRWSPDIVARSPLPATLPDLIATLWNHKDKLNPGMRIALWKLSKIQPNTPIHTHLDSKWKMISSVPVSSSLIWGMASLSSTLPGATPDSTNPVLQFAKDNWGKWALLGWGALALYKIFDKNDPTKDAGKWLFEKLTSWVPWGKLTLGTAIFFGALYFLFGDKIQKWIWVVDKFSDSAGKLMTIPEAMEKFQKGTPSEKKQVITDAVTGLGSIARDAFRELGKSIWVDVDKIMSPKDAESAKTDNSSADPESVLAARAYQAFSYKGFGGWAITVPWNSLTSNEKNILKWGNTKAHAPDILNLSHETAREKLPVLEAELASRNASIEKDLWARTIEIRKEFSSGSHPLYGRVDEIDARLADPTKWTEMEKWLIGSKMDEFIKISPELRRQHYFHFLARQELSAGIGALEYRIIAIKSGRDQFEAFKAMKGDPSLYYEQLRTLDADRIAQHMSLNTRSSHLDGRDWARFSDIARRFDEAIGEKDKMISQLVGETDDLTIKYNNATLDTEKALIKWQIDAKIQQIGVIEWTAQEMATKLFKENEKQLVQILNNAGTQRTMISSFLHHLPSWNNAKNFVKWNSTLPENLKDFNLFGSKNKYLRFGSFGTGIALIGIGAGLAKVDWHDPMDTAKRIAAGFVPIYGTGLDFHDSWESFKKWEIWAGFANLASWAVSGVGDAILWLSIITGIGTPIGIGTKSALAWVSKAIKMGMKVEAMSTADDLLAGGKMVFKMRDTTGKIVDIPVNLSANEARRYVQYTHMMESWKSQANLWKDVLTGKNGKRLMLWWMIGSLGFSGVALATAHTEWDKLTTINPDLK